MARHTIILDGNLDTDVLLREENTLASEAITPGDLCEFGGANDVQLHSTAGGNVRWLVALEQPWKEPSPALTTLAIDVDYAIGEGVRLAQLRRGVVAYMTLASGQNVAKDALLESAGNGHLQAWAVDAGNPFNLVGYAREAVNASAAAARIMVEIA